MTIALDTFAPTPVRDGVLTDEQRQALHRHLLNVCRGIRTAWQALEREAGNTSEPYRTETCILFNAHQSISVVLSLLNEHHSHVQEMAQLRSALTETADRAADLARERDEAHAELDRTKSAVVEFSDRMADILETAYEALPPATTDTDTGTDWDDIPY